MAEKTFAKTNPLKKPLANLQQAYGFLAEVMRRKREGKEAGDRGTAKAVGTFLQLGVSQLRKYQKEVTDAQTGLAFVLKKEHFEWAEQLLGNVGELAAEMEDFVRKDLRDASPENVFKDSYERLLANWLRFMENQVISLEKEYYDKLIKVSAAAREALAG